MAGFLSLSELQALPKAAVRFLVIAGGAAGNHTVTGIRVGDVLRAVLALDVAQDDHAVHGHDITTVVAAGGGAAVTEPAVAGPLESAGGGQTNPGAVDALSAAQAHTRTWTPTDLTAEFTISAADTINNAGGTVTTGQVLLVLWEDWTP